MPEPARAAWRSLPDGQRRMAIAAFGTAFLFAVVSAALYPFWFDELLTFYVSRLGGPAEIWTALEQPADGQPPLSYFLTILSHAVLGETELGTRAPALLAFLIATYALYLWTAERIGGMYGLIAAGFLWTTLLFEYSYEARPYTLMTACVAVALLSWRRACEGPWRRQGLAVLFLATALAMASHYYAVFALFAVGAGELARTWRRRKWDIAVWSALACGAGTVLFYLPLIQAARDAYSRGFWSQVVPVDTLSFYFICLLPAAISLLAFPYLIVVAWKLEAGPEKPEEGFPAEESVAMWALAASPTLTAFVATYTTGAYVVRYSLPAALGLAWIYAMFVWGCTRRRKKAVAVVAGMLVACFLAHNLKRAVHLGAEYRNGFLTGRTFAALEELDPPGQLPIVVVSPLDYFVFHHYAPERWRSRLIYLSDAEKCYEVENSNTAEVILNLFTRWEPLRVEERSAYLSRGEDFLLLERVGDTKVRDQRWLHICGKFDEQNLTLLHRTKDFALYRRREFR